VGVKLGDRYLKRLRHKLASLVDQHGLDFHEALTGTGKLHDRQIVDGKRLANHCADGSKVSVLGAEGGV
jgi:hypothetical protein